MEKTFSESGRNSLFREASRMVLSRYQAPVVASPNFVPVDTANCGTLSEFGSSG